MNIETCNWYFGINVSDYITFQIYEYDQSLLEVEQRTEKAGLYIFAEKTSSGWKPWYIGQSDDLEQRLPNHERWLEASSNGATHVHVACVPDKEYRDTHEQWLIEYNKPVLNRNFLSENSGQ
jgi:predicted GIY-YIG superfamily endonuclease